MTNVASLDDHWLPVRPKAPGSPLTFGTVMHGGGCGAEMGLATRIFANDESAGSCRIRAFEDVGPSLARHPADVCSTCVGREFVEHFRRAAETNVHRWHSGRLRVGGKVGDAVSLKTVAHVGAPLGSHTITEAVQ